MYKRQNHYTNLFLDFVVQDQLAVVVQRDLAAGIVILSLIHISGDTAPLPYLLSHISGNLYKHFAIRLDLDRKSVV